MKSYSQWILSVSFILCVLSNASCVNKIEDDIQESTVPISFRTRISKSTTRTNESAFEKGEQVGLFAMVSSTTLDGWRYINNLRLECGVNSLLIPEKEVFYPEGDVALDFISYYPYQKEGIEKGSTRLPISVQTDQSVSKAHSTSDFLLAQTSSVKSGDEPVELAYKHQLARISIVLSPKEGETVDNILKANPKITVTGFYTQAIYDFQTGTISDLSAKADISSYGTWKKQPDGTLSGKEFIVIPQPDTNSEQAFMLEWNGKLYTCPMPTLTMKGNTEFEIRIDALQTTSRVLTGIASNIKAWEYKESGESENNHNLTSIHVAALSFSPSDVYRVYHQSMPVAEICKEYLFSESNEIASRAIVVYPIQDEQTDLREGTVLRLLDKTGMVHGGSAKWNMQDNTLTYIPGNSEPIESFYIDENGKIAIEKPETPAAINVSSYTIRDIRNGVLKNYPIVKVGTQYWMREDLQTIYYNDGTSIIKQTKLGQGSGYYEWENYNLKLYNGEAILTNKLAPREWKIPSEKDWTLLKTYLNENASVLKAATSWTTGNGVLSPATGESGLDIFPNGLFIENNNSTIFTNRETGVAFWTYDSTQEELNKVVLLMNINNDIAFKETVKPATKDYYNAFSIRCIKE